MEATEQAKPRRSWIVIIGGGFIGFCFCMVIYIYLAKAFAAPPPVAWDVVLERARSDGKREAWVRAKELVRQGLKSPGTAAFDHTGEGQIQLADDVVTFLSLGSGTRLAGPDGVMDTRDDTAQLDGVEYGVRGWVDSQNDFGVPVRTRFSVRLQQDGDAWTTVSVSLAE